MATGYTHQVVEGKITEFSDFALSCARAFGALIDMRDEPVTAQIPEEFKPSTYSAERLNGARQRLAELNAMTTDQIAAAASASYAILIESHQRYLRDVEESNARVAAMREKVEAWIPPTGGHVEMKKFMLQQLDVSKREVYSQDFSEQTPNEWLDAQIEKAMHDIEYHAAEQAKEEARVAGRNEWIRQLRQSLARQSNEAA